MLSGCLDADYRPIMAIHHKLRQENIHIYDELAADKFFSIRMIGVENSQRGMGVATELIRRSGTGHYVKYILAWSLYCWEIGILLGLGIN